MLREYRGTLCPGGLYEWGREAQKDNSMTDELKKRMARLRELAPRLNAATDQASRVVAMVEKFLGGRAPHWNLGRVDRVQHVDCR